MSNMYTFVGNSVIYRVDPLGLLSWSPCEDVCEEHLGWKDDAKDRAKGKIKDKVKEWFVDKAGGKSAKQAKADCASLKTCKNPGMSSAKWMGSCMTCAVYKCAIASATPTAAENCLKVKLIGCMSGVAP